MSKPKARTLNRFSTGTKPSSIHGIKSCIAKGSYLPFSSPAAGFIQLRIYEDQVMLVMANLGVQDMENCTISVKKALAAHGASSVWEVTFQ